MNKSAIQKFAMGARTTLMEQVAQRAYQYGITKDGYGDANAVTVNGKALSTQEQSQRRELVREIQTKGYDQVMEEVAYTWFNRFIALRYMEVNNYLPSHIRVFSNAQGAFDPEILKVAHQIDLPGLDQSKVAEYIEKSETEALYRYLLLTQCNALNEGLPKMFEKMGGYTELLFPNNILRPDSVLGHMVSDIPEEDWTDQVQIIGWLYQYYNTELKAETFDLLKKNVKVTKERIPSATQLFTPDWIVRYMVENSLGRLWLEGHPNPALQESWKYYLDEAEQEPEVEARLVVLRSQRQTLRPEDITLIDPCMGSGHILVYAFDVLMQIYESEGWSQRDAAAAIVQKNLYGLDIDCRAAQLAYFAVMMKARQYDRRFLTRGIQPNLYHPGTYAGGQEFGSLIMVDELEPKPEQPAEITLFDGDCADKLNTWNFRSLLARQYDVVVTNPPYMGSSNMNDKLSKFVKENHPDTKGDLFACFIERGFEFAKPTGYVSMITMESWMFLSSFEKMRQGIVSGRTIINMVHMPYLGKGGTSLGINFGTAAVVLQTAHINNYATQFDCICYYETDEDGVPFQFPTINERYKVAKSANFSKIPGSPIAYWVSTAMLRSFDNHCIEDLAISNGQNITGNNNLFIRLFWEIEYSKICEDYWAKCARGGGYRKYFGNDDNVILWTLEAQNHYRRDSIARIIPEYLRFKAGITWSYITSGTPSFRKLWPYELFEKAGTSIFITNYHDLNSLLGLLNSKVARELLKIISPTLNYQVRDIFSIPVYPEVLSNSCIDTLVENNISIARLEWDSYETSWDFKRHPLV